jgi:hypothetical protein
MRSESIKYTQWIELQFLIIDANGGSVSNEKLEQTDAVMTRAFCYGLPTKFKVLLSINQPIRIIEAFLRAMDIRKVERADRERDRPFPRNGR